MLRLENLNPGAKVRGLAGASAVEIVRTEWTGADALNVVYRGADGPAEVLLFRDAEPRLDLLQATRAFSFDGDGESFRIASEAQRIRLAYLFDPYLAVHSSPTMLKGGDCVRHGGHPVRSAPMLVGHLPRKIPVRRGPGPEHRTVQERLAGG